MPFRHPHPQSELNIQYDWCHLCITQPRDSLVKWRLLHACGSSLIPPETRMLGPAEGRQRIWRAPKKDPNHFQVCLLIYSVV